MNKRDFAKIFNSDKFGQILIVTDIDDLGAPALKVSILPEGLGVCSTLVSFTDDDKGYEHLDKAFTGIDETIAEQIALNITKELKTFGVI